MAQKREKLLTDSDFSEKFSVPTSSSLLWLFLLKVDHVNSPPKWYPGNGRFSVAKEWSNWMREGETFCPENCIKEEEKSVWLNCEFHHHQRSSLLRFPFGSARRLFWFEINNIFVFLKRRKWQNCFSLHPHSSLPTWDPRRNPFHFVWCYDYGLPSFVVTDKQSMSWNKKTLKVCHWPRKNSFRVSKRW